MIAVVMKTVTSSNKPHSIVCVPIYAAAVLHLYRQEKYS